MWQPNTVFLCVQFPVMLGDCGGKQRRYSGKTWVGVMFWNIIVDSCLQKLGTTWHSKWNCCTSLRGGDGVSSKATSITSVAVGVYESVWTKKEKYWTHLPSWQTERSPGTRPGRYTECPFKLYIDSYLILFYLIDCDAAKVMWTKVQFSKWWWYCLEVMLLSSFQNL